MTVYYNEIDPFAAQWLRNLIAAGLIAHGDVDERSIKEVKPDDLKGYTQVHFFAGIGGWSLALRLAGWPDNRPVWTGSCPCQPFSAAGKGRGVEDERHLWPEMFRLIGECRPAVVFGEQVASKAGLGWFSSVRADLEDAGYAAAGIDLCAAGLGAPHIRQRLWWVGQRLGNAESHRPEMRQHLHGAVRGQGLAQGCNTLGLADATNAHGWIGERSEEAGTGADGERRRGFAGGCDHGGLADADGGDACAEREQRGGQQRQQPEDGLAGGERPGADHGGWSDADWLFCRDGKWRPTQSFFQSLVNGVSSELGSLRPGCIETAETKVISYAKANESDAAQDLRDLWMSIPSSPLIQRALGGFHGILKAEILFAYLCQLSVQGWRFSDAIPCPRGEVSGQMLRGMWRDLAASGASCGRELEEQRADQSPDALYSLSSILAQDACEAWGEDLASNAAHRSPLAHGIPNRVGSLRGYGNAIVPQVAAEVISAYMEAVTP